MNTKICCVCHIQVADDAKMLGGRDYCNEHYAKVTRDRLMVALDRALPDYGFARHKGYGTRQHREALARLGPSPIHRITWRPIREILEV